jgi:hypothetical protein
MDVVFNGGRWLIDNIELASGGSIDALTPMPGVAC